MSTKNIAAIIVAALVAGVVIGSFGIASAGGQVKLPAPGASECSSCTDEAACGEAAAAGAPAPAAAAAGCADCAEAAPAAAAPAAAGAAACRCLQLRRRVPEQRSVAAAPARRRPIDSSSRGRPVRRPFGSAAESGTNSAEALGRTEPGSAARELERPRGGRRRRHVLVDRQDHDRALVPPVSARRSRLRYYAERFDTVEADAPFYALPDRRVVNWAKRTPPGFIFHMKAYGMMTQHAVDERALHPELREYAGHASAAG